MSALTGIDFFSDYCVICRVFTLSAIILVLLYYFRVLLSILTHYIGTKIVAYQDTLLFIVPAFIVVRLYFCALLAMYVFFVCLFFATFLIPGIPS